MPIHTMVDLETMGNGNDAAIVQIGAVKFDPFAPGQILDAFSLKVSLVSAVESGGVMDPLTVLWWLSQDPRAIREVFPESIPINPQNSPIPQAPLLHSRALVGFAGFYQGSQKLWSHATFDSVILASAYRRTKIQLPWTFRDALDLRTIIWRAPEAAADAYKERGDLDGPRHEALADAKRQVWVLWRCLEKIGPENFRGMLDKSNEPR